MNITSNLAGHTIKTKEKMVYVIGTTDVVRREEVITSHIGINLSTGKADEIQGYFGWEYVRIEDLSKNHTKNLHYANVLRSRINQASVAILGKARSGKDTFAGSFKKTARQEFCPKSLSSPIKEIQTILFGPSDKKNRDELILIGQGLRKEDPNIWIKTFLNRLMDEAVHSDEIFGYLIPDVRQPNEYTFFRSAGAFTVKISANEEKRLAKIQETEAELDRRILKDQTETSVDNFSIFDYELYNDYDNKYLFDCRDVAKKITKRMIV